MTLYIPKELSKIFIDECLIGKSGRLNVNILRTNKSELLAAIAQTTGKDNLDLVEGLYWIYHAHSDYPKKCGCGANVTRFEDFKRGYLTSYCSSDCDFKRTQRAKKISENTDYVAASATRSASNIAKYGVATLAGLSTVKNKMEETMLTRYGVAHSFKLPAARARPRMPPAAVEKMRGRCLEKHGVSYTSQIPEVKEKLRQANTGRLIPESAIAKAKNTKFVKFKEKFGEVCKQSNVELLGNLLPNDRYSKCEYLCLACNKHFFRVTAGVKIKCTFCNTPISSLEEKFAEDLRSLGIKVEQRTRKIIKPKELDIWLPEYNIGIEVHGLYWHSEKAGKDKNAHLEKFKLAQDRGIHLFQFFEDELHDTSIPLSMVMSKIGKCKRLYARNLRIQESTTKDARGFFMTNHLAGFAAAHTYISLVDEANEVQMMMSVGKSRFDKSADLELVRLATKLGHIVVGGFQRLLSYVRSKFATMKLISYTDRRISTGHSYLRAGFTFEAASQPAYWYIKGKKRHSRFKFQKHKLQKILSVYDPNLSEKTNMEANGYSRIWDCGTLKFCLRL